LQLWREIKEKGCGAKAAIWLAGTLKMCARAKLAEPTPEQRTRFLWAQENHLQASHLEGCRDDAAWWLPKQEEEPKP
jgi:hypothetical protein